MKDKSLVDARMRLVETGGRTSQDLGAGRIVGQVLVFLYLQESECSLDRIGDDLGLSKASVSIAVRQLERLGLAKKVWKKGDRKNYFKSADNIGNALQKGILALVRQKVSVFGEELDAVGMMLGEVSNGKEENSKEISFLQQRVTRARKLQRRLNKLLDNPIINLLTKKQ